MSPTLNLSQSEVLTIHILVENEIQREHAAGDYPGSAEYREELEAILEKAERII